MDNEKHMMEERAKNHQSGDELEEVVRIKLVGSAPAKSAPNGLLSYLKFRSWIFFSVMLNVVTIVLFFAVYFNVLPSIHEYHGIKSDKEKSEALHFQCIQEFQYIQLNLNQTVLQLKECTFNNNVLNHRLVETTNKMNAAMKSMANMEDKIKDLSQSKESALFEIHTKNLQLEDCNRHLNYANERVKAPAASSWWPFSNDSSNIIPSGTLLTLLTFALFVLFH